MMHSTRSLPVVSLFLMIAASGRPALAEQPKETVQRQQQHSIARPPPGQQFHPGPTAFGRGDPRGVDVHNDRRFDPHKITDRVRGKDVRILSNSDRTLWRGGRWHQEWHDGRYGWWWEANGARYWYPQPVYPYPTVISEVIAEEAPVPPQSAPYIPFIPQIQVQMPQVVFPLITFWPHWR